MKLVPKVIVRKVVDAIVEAPAEEEVAGKQLPQIHPDSSRVKPENLFILISKEIWVAQRFTAAKEAQLPTRALAPEVQLQPVRLRTIRV